MDSVITARRVTPEKRARAKQLRRQMTLAERELWRQLRANRLNGYQFRRQQVIDGFIVDFYCHTLKLIIEVDGPIHDSQAQHDRGREYLLTGRDLRILRFNNDELLQDLPSVLAHILATTQ
ncbi:MAG TPA: DUF559 domain-containing protein [Thermomicrobiales bacterium]|jgi:very-short-patch-repair endonuclease